MRVVLLLCAAAAEAHFMWLKDSCLGEPGCTQPNAVVTFAEAAGSAESLDLLKMVQNSTHVFVQGGAGAQSHVRKELKWQREHRG